MNPIRWIRSLFRPQGSGQWKMTWLPNKNGSRQPRHMVPQKVQSGPRKGRQLEPNWLKYTDR